jgi:hypothetical protein
MFNSSSTFFLFFCVPTEKIFFLPTIAFAHFFYSQNFLINRKTQQFHKRKHSQCKLQDLNGKFSNKICKKVLATKIFQT